MGKATILGSGSRNLERGQYRIKIEKDDARVVQESKRLSSEISALEPIITQSYSDYSNTRNAHSSTESDLDAIIRQSIESPKLDISDKIRSATAAERDSYTNMIAAKSRHQVARLKQKSLQNKKLYLNDISTEDIRTVWCADCQRTLTGTVATIEIPNTDDTILIRPGGANGSGSNYLANRDGQLRYVAAMSPAEAVWNFTMFPGWQKWYPLYRLGKITERIPNNNKCSVLLDAYSTEQGLKTDVERQLTNVPMVYKNRKDGGPYVIGDRVVIEFSDQNFLVPKVVGFEREPCTTSTISATTTTTTTLALMYIQDWTGAVLTYDADTGAFLEPLGNTPYCPGAPPCVFKGLATSGAKLIQGALFHRKIIVLDADTGAIENVYTDAYAQVFGAPPPAYPIKRFKGIQELAYDPVTGNLVSITNDPIAEVQGYVVVYDGISDTVLSANHLIIPGGIQVAPLSITVVDGNMVIYGIYTIPLPGASVMITMNGLSMTVTNVISWPIANRYMFMTSHNGNIIGTGVLADTKKVTLHDGVTPTILGSFYLPYDPEGIAVLDD